MKRVILGAVGIALSCTVLSTASACHHHRAMQMQFARFQPFYVSAPAPVYQAAPSFHQYQTIGGPAPTMVMDSAPIYGAPMMEAAPAPVQYVEAAPAPQYVQAAPVAVAAPEPTYVEAAAPVDIAVETVPVEATHPVQAIAEGPVASDAIESVPATQYVEAAAPVQVATQYVEAAPAPVQYVQAAPAPIQYVSAPAPTFVQTPLANRATVVQTYFQPQMMYLQAPPTQIIMMQAAPRRGCRHCGH